MIIYGRKGDYFMEFKKAITLSFDDGMIYDERMVELFNKYNLKCTFNLNAGLQAIEPYWQYPETDIKLYRKPIDELIPLYEGHEVAAHGYTHADLPNLSDEELYKELSMDVYTLEEKFGYKIEGFAYPCGNYDKRTLDILKELGIKYARTAKSSFETGIQENLLEFAPSWHIPFHITSSEHSLKLDEAVNRFLSSAPDKPQVLCLWGHSFELEVNNSWDVFEDFLARISNKDDIFYGTNKDVFKYFKLY